MTNPELYRPVGLDRLCDGDIEVHATTAECAAIAARLLLPAVASVHCRWHCESLPGGVVAARGVLRASVTQTCVVSLDPFPAAIDEHFEVRFVPASEIGDEDESEDIDEIPYEGFEIDLGEATIEQLALSLDPYPRKPGATLPEEATDERAHPFAGIAALSPKLPDGN